MLLFLVPGRFDDRGGNPSAALCLFLLDGAFRIWVNYHWTLRRHTPVMCPVRRQEPPDCVLRTLFLGFGRLVRSPGLRRFCAVTCERARARTCTPGAVCRSHLHCAALCVLWMANELGQACRVRLVGARSH